MNIQRIEHFSINIINRQKSFDFYSRVMGFSQQQTVDCGDFDITYFAIPGGSRLELFDYHGKNARVSHQESDTGLRHLAFQVVDVTAHEKLLRDQGVEITLPTCDLPNLGVRVLLFLDPNGVTLEFCESL